MEGGVDANFSFRKLTLSCHLRVWVKTLKLQAGGQDDFWGSETILYDTYHYKFVKTHRKYKEWTLK